MQRIDLPSVSPAEALAADEAWLDGSEAGRGGEALLFWEPRESFVVVGYANKVATEVNVAACEARGVKIFRRCSGGGAIVQMPGGLNYGLILRITDDGPTRTISSANQFIMERNRAAIQSAVGPGLVISVRGHTDLAMADSGAPDAVPRKFAGNSQRRRRQFLLFHGTLLLACDLRGIGEWLRMPSQQPDYRANRPHDDFVGNLPLPAAAVKAALARAWNAAGPPAEPPMEEIARLAGEKYSSDAWNYKF
jgi:lipoate-protein ligase A